MKENVKYGSKKNGYAHVWTPIIHAQSYSTDILHFK